MTRRRSSNRRGRVPLERLRRTGGVPLAAAPRPAKPPTEERGASGGVTWGGVLSGLNSDFAEAWRLPTRWATVEKMAADPAVSACISALVYPIVAAELKVEPASDDPEDRRLADFVEDALDGMTVSLTRHRMQVMGYLAEGVRVFETVYERRKDDLWWLRKLALRPNKTIGSMWHSDDHGGPDGVTQTNPSTGEQLRLTMDQLLIFTHLGDDAIIGRPATRAMFRPWYLIDAVSRIGAIAIERHGVGIPWARYTGTSDTERDKVDLALMDMHANESLFFRVDNDVPEWGVMGVSGTMLDPVPFMEFQRRDLFLAPLAQFLVLGTDGVGAQALSRDHSGLFLLTERAVAREIDDTYNRFLVPRMIGYNWTIPADRMPRVCHGVIDQRSALDWATAVAQVVQAGVELPMRELSHTAAHLLGLAMPDDADQPAADVADVNDPNAPEGDTGGGQGPAEYRAKRNGRGVTLAAKAGRLVSVVKMEALGVAPDFVKMSAALDGGRDRIIARVGALQDKQARILAKLGAKLVRAGDAPRVAGLLAGDPEAFNGVELAARPRRLVSYDEEAAIFEEEMDGLYDDGESAYADELDQQGVRPKPTSGERRGRDKAKMAALAMVAGALLADRLQNAWAAEVLRQMGGPARQAPLLSAMTGLSGKLLESLAGQRANEALALGREAMAEANPTPVMLSAVMDQNTCGACADLDGTEYDSEMEAPRVPLDVCLGGAMCRCELIPLVRGG